MEVVCCLGKSFEFSAIASRATQGLWTLRDGFQIKSGMTIIAIYLSVKFW